MAQVFQWRTWRGPALKYRLDKISLNNTCLLVISGQIIPLFCQWLRQLVMSNTWILMIILHNSTLLLTVHEEGIRRFLWSIGIPVFIFVLSRLAFLALFYSRWVWTSKLAREERWRNRFWERFGNYFWKKFSLAGETNTFRTVNKISNCWEYAVSRAHVVHMVDYSSANEFPNT